MAKRDDERLPSRRIAALLRGEIEAGTRAPGASLPSYRAIAQQHGVSKTTAQAAVQLLADDGLVVVRAASGVYVRDPAERPTSLRDLRIELDEIRNRLHSATKELSETEEAVIRLSERLALPGWNVGNEAAESLEERAD